MDVRNLRQIDLNLLLAFQVLATERSVTRAARQLGVGQPAMSASLARLRDLFEDELLVRSGRGMRLTPRAEALAERVRLLLAGAESIFGGEVEFEARSASRHFTLTLTPDGCFQLLQPLLRRLEAEAPDVELRVQHFTSEARLGLETGESDLWVLPEFRAASMYSYELLVEDRLCLVGCAERHRETRLSDARDLEKLHFADLEPPRDVFPTESNIELRRFADRVRIGVVIPSRLEAAMAVIGTHHVFFAPERLARAFARMLPLRVLSLPGADIAYRLCMQWHPASEADPAQIWLRNRVREVASGL